MVQLLKTEAFVVRKRELLQQDVMITLFTADSGKVTVIAKGIKSMTSRRGPHLQTGNLISVMLSVRGDYRYLQQTTLISGFSAVKDDSRKTDYMYLYFFVLDRILPDNEPEPRVYRLTKAFLADLARRPEFSATDMATHLSGMLAVLGYVSEPRSMIDLIPLVEEIIHEKIPFRII